MKNKKGGVHVDWIISAGIFLVYIMSLFMFIRPGARSEHNEDILLSIVEEHLEEEIYINISKTPIFVSGGNVQEGEFPFSGDSSNFNINDRGGNIAKFSITNGELIIEANDNFYWLIYSENANFIHDGAVCPVSGCSTGSISYGVSEVVYGVSEAKVNSLISSYKSDSGYDDLKTKWGFPESKNFAFSFNSSNGFNEYKIKEPFQQTSVYAKEWKDFILDPVNGNLEEVTINVRIW